MIPGSAYIPSEDTAAKRMSVFHGTAKWDPGQADLAGLSQTAHQAWFMELIATLGTAFPSAVEPSLVRMPFACSCCSANRFSAALSVLNCVFAADLLCGL